MLFECFLTSIDSKAKLFIYNLFINSSKKGSSDWNKLQWDGTWVAFKEQNDLDARAVSNVTNQR